MTAPDDLARTLAEHREVKPWVCLCGWWSAIQEPDGSDYARHLASVVSRRDADLRTRIEQTTAQFESCWCNPDPNDDGDWRQRDCPIHGSDDCKHMAEGAVALFRRALDDDTRETLDVEALGVPTSFAPLGDAQARRPADTDTGRGQ